MADSSYTVSYYQFDDAQLVAQANQIKELTVAMLRREGLLPAGRAVERGAGGREVLETPEGDTEAHINSGHRIAFRIESGLWHTHLALFRFRCIPTRIY